MVTVLRTGSNKFRQYQTKIQAGKQIHTSFFLHPLPSAEPDLNPAFFDCTALGPTVILRALTCLDKGPETEGLVVY